ncbi:MAG: methyltransferase domain-containing protein [Pyrinomonadaceae bacterium]
MWTPGLGILTKVRQIVGPQDEINELRRELDQLAQVVTSLTQRYQNSLPLPPEELRLHVGMRTSAANFLAQGSNSSERVLEVFGQSPQKPMLDWGCGSGRTLRWLMAYPAWLEQYHGCDVDTAAIAWLKENGVDRVAVCNDNPPLP